MDTAQYILSRKDTTEKIISDKDYRRPPFCSNESIKEPPIDWEIKFVNALDAYRQYIDLDVRIKALEREIICLRRSIIKMQSEQSVSIPIETFNPEPYEVIKSFNVVVQYYEGEYLASFFDADIYTSGETINEAYINIKDLIISTFEMLLSHKKNELGLIPLKQLSVLGSFIKKRK